MYARILVALDGSERTEPIVPHVEAHCRLPADLIAMVTEGKAGLKRPALGSVAEAVLCDAPVPFCWYEHRRADRGLSLSLRGRGRRLTGFVPMHFDVAADIPARSKLREVIA